MRSEMGSTAVLGVAEDSWTNLPLHAWEALPLPIRVQHRLAEMLMLVDEVRAEFRDEADGTLQWMDTEVERIGDSLESLLDRLAC